MNNDTSSQPEQFDPIKKASFEINAVITQLGQFGGNDFEIPEVQGLLTKLEEGKVSPEEAVLRANEILNSKMGMGSKDSYL